MREKATSCEDRHHDREPAESRAGGGLLGAGQGGDRGTRWAGPPQGHLGASAVGKWNTPPLGTAGLLGTFGVSGLAWPASPGAGTQAPLHPTPCGWWCLAGRPPGSRGEMTVGLEGTPGGCGTCGGQGVLGGRMLCGASAE